MTTVSTSRSTDLVGRDAELVYSMHKYSTIPEASVAEIVDRAEGNAFFVEELVGATWATGGQIPTELADVLLVRLDGLDDRTLEIVRVASVAGRHVSHELLAAVTGLGAEAAAIGRRAGLLPG